MAGKTINENKFMEIKMKEFLLIFRTDFKNTPDSSPEEIQATNKRWMDWIGGIAAQNKLFDKGNRLANNGRVIRANKSVIDGPYTEIKESIGGYIIIKVESYNEAVDIGKGCPIFNVGGNVEIREISKS